MACKKSELVLAINSFASACSTNDPNLIKFASELVTKYVETLEFAPEQEQADAEES